jgi:hypothetical protein
MRFSVLAMKLITEQLPVLPREVDGMAQFFSECIRFEIKERSSMRSII